MLSYVGPRLYTYKVCIHKITHTYSTKVEAPIREKEGDWYHEWKWTIGDLLYRKNLHEIDGFLQRLLADSNQPNQPNQPTNHPTNQSTNQPTKPSWVLVRRLEVLGWEASVQKNPTVLVLMAFCCSVPCCGWISCPLQGISQYIWPLPIEAYSTHPFCSVLTNQNTHWCCPEDKIPAETYCFGGSLTF